jgi:steroid delta-isomerase-like uncharacterized protein
MENGQVLDRINEEAFNQGRVDVLDELVADDFVEHDPMPGTPPDREGFKGMIRSLREAFPDFHAQTDDQIVAGDKVVERWTCTGTHEGEFIGAPATHRRIEIHGMDISRLEDGRLVEHWTQVDMLSLLQQLGMLPEEAQEQAKA